MLVVKFHAECSRFQRFFQCALLTRLNLEKVCFWIELQQFLFRQKYHSFESLYEFSSMACSVQSEVANTSFQY
jgi:hypothetical protein